MTERRVRSRGAPNIEFAEQPLSVLEVRAALLTCAGLYVVGGMLCATAALLPHVRAPEAIVAVAINALLVAAALVYAAERERGGLPLAFVADLWGVVLIAVLCAAGGGANSPFALIYLFAAGHAAAFQPRRHFILVALACLIAFLLPLAYETVSGTFGAVACVGIVLALLTTAVIHYALGGAREHRHRLKFLIDATATFDTSLEPAEALRNLARAAVPELAELCVIDLLDRDGTIGDTVAAFRTSAEERGVHLAAELPAEKVVAEADAEKVQRVLFNLIQNAIRHTPADGSVTVRAKGGPGGVEVEVADSGEGIPAGEGERVFEAFYRGDSARGEDGAGLGLAISRAIVEAHGGRIWLEDGHPGTRVRFTLPA